jgi:hypothetical protein
MDCDPSCRSEKDCGTSVATESARKNRMSPVRNTKGEIYLLDPNNFNGFDARPTISS